MTPRVWSLVGADAMRALDRHTIETLGVPGELLMESAGRAVTETVLGERAPGGEVLVVCGSGNNGGDGFVVARHLHALGVPVRIALLSDESRLRGDALASFRRARSFGVPVEGARWRAPARGVLVDAVFGTGLSRDVEGAPAASLRRMREVRDAHPDLRVVAVDLPSGLCADTGRVLGVAVRADVTVTIQCPKPGLALEPGRSLAGRVLVARIGIAEQAPDAEKQVALWTRAAHKGTFGHVLLAAGSEGKTGAAALAAEGAARAGCGLVTVACPAGVDDILEIKCTEAMTAPLPDTSERAFAAAALEPLVALAAERDAVGLGPGIGRGAETGKLVRELVARVEVPLALDADGLFALAGHADVLAGRRAPTLLTPHPGEAAHLLGTSPAAVNRDRVGAARRLAAEMRAVVLLKGAATVAAAPDGRALVNPTGGPALGSGGTGDVLLGVAAGLLAQGLDVFEAAGLAAFVHGLAGDRIAAREGDSGLLAGDLARELPFAFARLRSEARSERPGERLAIPFPEP